MRGYSNKNFVTRLTCIMAAKEFEESAVALKYTNHIRQEVRVAWQPPDAGWVKCNVDGASRKGGLTAGCGGIIRDSMGRWEEARFMMNLGRLDSLSAEIWSMAWGLDLAWEKGFKRVILESDSRQAINLIGRGILTEHPLVELVQRIREKLDRDWEIVLNHCLRNANAAADWLGSTATRRSGGRRVLEETPEELRAIVRRDCHSFGSSREDLVD